MKEKSLNIVIKHVFICNNPYIYTTFVQEVYYRDCSPEIDDVGGLAAAPTKHLELLKQKDKAEGSSIIENILGKLLRSENTNRFQLHQPPARFQRMGVSLTL